VHENFGSRRESAVKVGDIWLLTEARRAAIASTVEASWVEMMAGARALNPDRIRAGYVDRPIVAINGRIIDDFDRDQFQETSR
jgi:hypothetical protein